MTIRTGKDRTAWDRGFAPVGFLVLLFTLFLPPLSLSETIPSGGHPERAATEGGVAPSPLSTAADDLWFPASGHAERRAAKVKASLPHVDAGGKALAPTGGVWFYPVETASREAFPAADDAVPVRSGLAAFRSRAPPAVFA